MPVDFLTRGVETKRLLLPDGRRADGLRLGQLYEALTLLKTPSITPEMGKPVLLKAYADQIHEVAKTLPEQKEKLLGFHKLSEIFMRQATALIAKQAVQSNGTPPLHRPAPRDVRPLITTSV